MNQLIADVVLDTSITRLDHPFSYLVPEKFASSARVGLVVRVPLRNRKIRGWIVRVRQAQLQLDESAGLSEISALSGLAPLFDEALLKTAQAVARRYVQPLGSVLSLMTPARMGGRGTPAIPESTDSLGRGSRLPPKKTIRMTAASEDPIAEYEARIQDALSAGLGAIVTVPEVLGGSRVLEELGRRFSDEVALVHSGIDEPQRSQHLWEVALGKRRVVLGGRAAMFAPAFSCGVLIVHDEHDRSLKEQRSPHYDARVVAEIRAERTGADVLMTSASPSIAWWHEAPGWVRAFPERAFSRQRWPIVETVEPPTGGSGRLPRRVIAALIETRSQSKKSVVLVPRVSGIDRTGSFLQRVLPSASVSTLSRPTGAKAPKGVDDELRRALESDVIVATTAVLADVDRPGVGCAVVLGVDAILARPYGRAIEDATQEIWELARWVGNSHPERGRVVVETRASDHHAVQALVRGDYGFFATRELERRKADRSPPYVTLVRLRGAIDDATAEALRALPGTEVLGPAPDPDSRQRLTALLKVEDVEAVLDPLREALWASDVGILVEVDPREW